MLINGVNKKKTMGMKDTGTDKTVQLVFILFYFILRSFVIRRDYMLRGEATNINFIILVMT